MHAVLQVRELRRQRQRLRARVSKRGTATTDVGRAPAAAHPALNDLGESLGGAAHLCAREEGGKIHCMVVTALPLRRVNTLARATPRRALAARGRASAAKQLRGACYYCDT
jgi:hypothetical protein